jgi:drug/metabolite transporter (DMT)-like permease
VRVRLGRRRPPRRTLVGFVLILAGVSIVLTALPGFVYAAVIGGLIAYIGYTLIGR